MRRPRRARVGVSIVFAVCGAGFATWAARVPAAQQQLGLSPGQLAVGLFGLAAGSVAALVVAGPLVTTIGSRWGSLLGALVLCAGLPAVAFAPDLPVFVGALAVLGVGNSLLDVSMNAHAARVEAEYGRPIFCGFVAEGTVNDWGAVLLTTTTDAAQSVASLGYFAFSISMIAVRLVADRAAERVGAVLVTRLSAGLTVCGFGLAVATTDPVLGVVAFAVIGLGVSAIVPLAWSSAARKEPAAPGRAIAAVATCGYLGFLVGPILVGALATGIGLAPAVMVAGGTAVVVVVLAPSLRVPVVRAEVGGTVGHGRA